MACPKKKISYRNKKISYNKSKFLKFNSNTLLKVEEFIMDYKSERNKFRFKFILR